MNQDKSIKSTTDFWKKFNIYEKFICNRTGEKYFEKEGNLYEL